MPYAVTHILVSIILIDIYRDYVAKKKFPRKYVLFGGIAGLLPDMDIPIGWAYNLIFGTHIDFHGTITHFYIIALAFGILALVFRGKGKWGLIFALLSVGWFLHVSMDCVFTDRFALWPLPIACPGLVPVETLVYNLYPAMDAVLLVGWLIREERKGRIKDYI